MTKTTTLVAIVTALFTMFAVWQSLRAYLGSTVEVQCHSLSKDDEEEACDHVDLVHVNDRAGSGLWLLVGASVLSAGISLAVATFRRDRARIIGAALVAACTVALLATALALAPGVKHSDLFGTETKDHTRRTSLAVAALAVSLVGGTGSIVWAMIHRRNSRRLAARQAERSQS